MRKVSLWGCMILILTLWFQEMTLFGILNKYPSLACLSVSFLAVRRCSSLSGYTNTLNSNRRLWIVHFEKLRLVKGFWVNLRRLLIQENYHYSVGCSQGLVRRELPADYIYDFPICRVKVMPHIQNWPLLLTCRLMWINLCFLNGVMKLNVRRISNYSLLFGRNTSTRPGMVSRYLMAEFCEPVCSVKAWCAGEQEQKYPARPRARHPRGQFPVRGIRPFRLEVERRGDPVDGSWQDMLSSPRI